MVILYFVKETQNSITELHLANCYSTSNTHLFPGGLARPKLKTYFVGHQASRKLNLYYMALFLLVSTIWRSLMTKTTSMAYTVV